jgi:hypothetical protein
MSTLAVNNFKPSSGGTPFSISGIAKGYAQFDGITPSINGSINTSSLTDNGVGNFTVNWANDFLDANYCFVANSSEGVTYSPWWQDAGIAAGSFTIETHRLAAATFIDPYRVHVQGTGDLA